MTDAPLLSVCMIVRDEERFLPGCLSSLAGLSDELIVVDTGSRDGTVAIAREHGAQVLTHTWTGDYAEARNVSIAAAQGRFVLYFDADEEISGQDKTPLREAIASDAYDAINVDIVSPLFGSDKENIVRYVRVFRNYPDACFRYRIHEQIWPSLAPHAPRVLQSHFRILHHGYNQPEEVLQLKRRRNLDTALEVLETEPDNGFYLYHAGIGHLTLGDARQGIRWLERALRHVDPPLLPAVHNALAQAHYDLSELELAERALMASTNACPQQHHGWALLADIYLLGNRHSDAIRALSACLEVDNSALLSDLSPPQQVLLLKLGLSQLLTHDVVGARESLERALALGLDGEQTKTATRYLALADRMGA